MSWPERAKKVLRHADMPGLLNEEERAVMATLAEIKHEPYYMDKCLIVAKLDIIESKDNRKGSDE